MGAVPLATLVQVPTVPVMLHALHVPVQAWLQQTPCAQKLESHSLAVVQLAPVGFSVQVFALQMFGATQSAATPHVVRQVPAGMSHWYFPQDDVVAAAQTPAPSHRRAEVKVEPVQLPATHCVPLMYLRQAPAPLQVPSLPQVDAAAIGHCDAVTGALPAAIGVHVPMLVAIAQDMQVPAHMLLQQTPSTQNPDAQSVPTPDGQSPPIGILPQLMFTQELPDTQSAAAVVHDVLQAAVPHR